MLPIETPLPHPPTYHFHDAPVPNEPPVTLILVFPPLHIAGVTAVALVAADGRGSPGGTVSRMVQNVSACAADERVWTVGMF